MFHEPTKCHHVGRHVISFASFGERNFAGARIDFSNVGIVKLVVWASQKGYEIRRRREPFIWFTASNLERFPLAGAFRFDCEGGVTTEEKILGKVDFVYCCIHIVRTEYN